MNKTIILIPGLGGSKIYCNCNNTYPNDDDDDNYTQTDFISRPIKPNSQNLSHGTRLYPSRFMKLSNMNKHFFYCTNTKTKPLLSYYHVSIYKRLIKRLQRNGAKCKIFSYDWRLNPVDNCNRLKKYLENLIFHFKKSSLSNTDKELILVGHSLGGLMIRILMEYLHFPIDNIFKIFICGTPLVGSLNFYDYNCKINIKRILLHDKNINSEEIPQPILISKHDVITFIQTFPCTMLYLLPTFELNKLNTIPNVNIHELYICRTIHNTLSKFIFPGKMLYTLIFNISQKRSINYKIPEAQITHYTFLITEQDSKELVWNFNENTFNISSSRFTDGTVIPCFAFPSNCSIIFDNNYLKHSLIMNSLYISQNIMCAK